MTETKDAPAADILKELLGVNISVRALEHINGRMAEHVNPYWESASPPPADEEGEILVVTADGKGVPMRQNQQERYEEELGKKKPKRRKPLAYEKTTKRGSCGAPKSRKQMAYLGVVYSVDRFVRRPQEIVDEVQRRARQQQRPQPQHPADAPRPRGHRLPVWTNGRTDVCGIERSPTEFP